MLLSGSPESKLSPQISGSLIGREDEVVASRGQMTSSEKDLCLHSCSHLWEPHLRTAQVKWD